MEITFNEISIITPSYRRAGNIKAINMDIYPKSKAIQI